MTALGISGRACKPPLVVVEGPASDRAPIRAAFQTTRRTPTKHVPPRTFDSLSAAFARAAVRATRGAQAPTTSDAPESPAERTIQGQRRIAYCSRRVPHDKAPDHRRGMSQPRLPSYPDPAATCCAWVRVSTLSVLPLRSSLASSSRRTVDDWVLLQCTGGGYRDPATGTTVALSASTRL